MAGWGLRGAWALMGGGALLVLLASVAPFSSYRLDLLSHFAPHAMLPAVGSLALALLWRSTRAIWGSVGLTLCLLVLILARYQPFSGSSPEAETFPVRVAVYNAFARGAERRGSELDNVFRAWLVNERVDLVCLVDPPWFVRRSGLWPGEEHLPNVVERATEHGQHTITLLSRWPVRLEPLTGEVDPKYRLSFAAYSSVIVKHPSGGEFLFTAAHPRSPRTERTWELSQRWARVDNELIRAWMRTNDAPVIFAGDFNTTPMGALHRQIVRETGLRSPTEVFTQGTWPAGAPSLFALPIDRVYVSEGVGVRDARVGPRVYSDHRPVVYELEVPAVRRGESEADQNPQ